MTLSQHDADLAPLVGRRVASAASSLDQFALAFDDGSGLLAQAHDTAAPRVIVEARPAASLPALAEAVCAVDWSWIVGARVQDARLVEGQLRLQLDPPGPLTISAALWQGRPFLAFQPYRPPPRT
ncbi:MAG: hypothetical protein IRZ14_20605 [Chloroflexi bacterium]|mgnify:FL=1|nr:hypothetical protein [Chloroflexota bacterium]